VGEDPRLIEEVYYQLQAKSKAAREREKSGSRSNIDESINTDTEMFSGVQFGITNN
jgi:hypothetical protein